MTTAQIAESRDVETLRAHKLHIGMRAEIARTRGMRAEADRLERREIEIFERIKAIREGRV